MNKKKIEDKKREKDRRKGIRKWIHKLNTELCKRKISMKEENEYDK